MCGALAQDAPTVHCPGSPHPAHVTYHSHYNNNNNVVTGRRTSLNAPQKKKLN